MSAEQASEEKRHPAAIRRALTHLELTVTKYSEGFDALGWYSYLSKRFRFHESCKHSPDDTRVICLPAASLPDKIPDFARCDVFVSVLLMLPLQRWTNSVLVRSSTISTKSLTPGPLLTMDDRIDCRSTPGPPA